MMRSSRLSGLSRCCTRHAANGTAPAKRIRSHSSVAAANSSTPESYVDERSPPPNPTLPHPQNTPPRFEAIKTAKPFSSFLTDTFNRQHDYLRISITEKCNLRCLYCMPEEGIELSPKKHLLTVPEIHYLSSLFVSQGVTKIRLTGGEPTVHPQILPLIRDIGSLRSRGLRELAITTNGLTLARKLDSMVASGLTGINLSLDTLDPFQFEIMTRRRGFDQVMKSITRILEMNRAGASIKLKINAVVIRGLNDAQILPFVEMTNEKDLEVRFIEYMPFDGNRWSSQKMLGYQEMLAVIREKYPTLAKVQDHPNDTSKTFQIPGFAGRIGFITSMTNHFCGSCNRLRITSDGNLKVCLFGNAEVNLRDMLRERFNGGEPIDEAAWEAVKQVEMDRHEGRTEGDLGSMQKEMELLDVIGMAVKRKKAQHAGIGNLEHMKNRPMILIDHPETIALTTPSSPSSHFPRPLRNLPRPTRRLSYNIPFHILSQPPLSLYSTSQSRLYTTTRTLPTEYPNTTTITAKSSTSPAQHLTHLTSSGEAHMVHIPPPQSPSSITPQPPQSPSPPSPQQPKIKPPTSRRAIATSTLVFSHPGTASLIHSASLKKGDVFSVSRIAGIMAAKKTSDLIPLCHNIGLSGVEVGVELILPTQSSTSPSSTSSSEASDPQAEGNSNEPSLPNGGIHISASVSCFGQTGVEMEALTAASVAALTAYDMCKGVDKGLRIEGTRVVLKEGGRSGVWREGVKEG